MTGNHSLIRLAAIAFTDIVGFSAIVHQDPVQGKALLDRQREVIRTALARCGGREIETAGDSFLLEFESTHIALDCIVEIQRGLREDNQQHRSEQAIIIRASIHLGDIEHHGAEVYGDCINVGARILPYSPPGGVALSDVAHRQVRHRLPSQTRSIGATHLKNINQPIELFVVDGELLIGVEPASGRSVRIVDTSPAGRRARSSGSQGRVSLRWSFAGLQLDEKTLELKKSGALVEIERTLLEVLQYLLWHAGEVVTSGEIIDAVWPGRILADDVVSSCIERLRIALDDNRQQIIRTVHGYGYRLAVPVDVDRSDVRDITSPAHFDFQLGDAVPLRPQWKLLERLGSGSSGEAWLAEHEKTRERRAYKFALNDEALVGLKREITLYRLLHDTLGERGDIVRIIDWNVAESPFFTEAEYARGGNLAAWAEKKGGLLAIPLAIRLDFIVQIASTLSAAHSVGVLHKDLKPANVLVVERAEGILQTQLADFGSGTVVDPSRLDQLNITRLGLTLACDDSIAGTAIYLAPEIQSGKPATVQADIYSLGVMAYQLIVGDFRRPLAPGWELDVEDELLREDIAIAADGNPLRRLADAAELGRRIASLQSRHKARQSEREQAERERTATARIEKAQRDNERLRARRTGLLTALALLIAGFFVTAWLYFDASRARQQAQSNARDAGDMSAFVVSDILGAFDPAHHDMREMTAVRTLLDGGAAKIDERFRGRLLLATKLRIGLIFAYASVGASKQIDLLKSRVRDDVEAALASGAPDAVEAGAAFAELISRLEDVWSTADYIDYWRRLTAAASRQLPPEDPRRLVIDLAAVRVLHAGGDDERAIALLAEAEKTVAAGKSADVDLRRKVLKSRVDIDLDLGKIDDALASLRELVPLDDDSLGPNNGLSVNARISEATLLAHCGSYGEADLEIESALAHARATRGEDALNVLRANAFLGYIRALEGRSGEAASTLDALAARLELLMANDASDLEGYERILAESHEVMGLHDSAEKEFRVTLDILGKQNSGDTNELSLVRLELAEVLASTGRVDEASGLLDQMQPIDIEKFQRWPLRRRELQRLRGLIAKGKGRKAEAVEDLTDAYELELRSFGEKSFFTRQSREELANATAS